jgi:hypothetical protein
LYTITIAIQDRDATRALVGAFFNDEVDRSVNLALLRQQTLHGAAAIYKDE